MPKTWILNLHPNRSVRTFLTGREFEPSCGHYESVVGRLRCQRKQSGRNVLIVSESGTKEGTSIEVNNLTTAVSGETAYDDEQKMTLTEVPKVHRRRFHFITVSKLCRICCRLSSVDGKHSIDSRRRISNNIRRSVDPPADWARFESPCLRINTHKSILNKVCNCFKRFKFWLQTLRLFTKNQLF